LIDFHDDLKRDLPPASTPQNAEKENSAAVLKRLDTETNSVDEFVDAES
jgi:hypothetical protein